MGVVLLVQFPVISQTLSVCQQKCNREVFQEFVCSYNASWVVRSLSVGWTR